jgi:hypothetical protein
MKKRHKKRWEVRRYDGMKKSEKVRKELEELKKLKEQKKKKVVGEG